MPTMSVSVEITRSIRLRVSSVFFPIDLYLFTVLYRLAFGDRQQRCEKKRPEAVFASGIEEKGQYIAVNVFPDGDSLIVPRW